MDWFSVLFATIGVGWIAHVFAQAVRESAGKEDGGRHLAMHTGLIALEAVLYATVIATVGMAAALMLR